MQAIVKRAESSVGSFYARFSGKDDLLEYLGNRVWREAATRWDEALALRDLGEVGLAGLVEGSVRLLSESQRSRSSYLRALDRAAGGSEEAYSAFRDHLLRGIETLLLDRADEITHPDPERAVWVGLRGVMGVIDAEWAQPGDGSLEALARDATELLMSYLVPGEGPGTEGAGEVEFFDIWG